MVFCEPVQQIVPHINQQLLKTLRDFTKKNNILLGFDEMITGFRLSIGGAQEYLNIHADIACYGKIIGGGYPIGVVGFNKEINSHINNVELPIRFGGTFSGNPLSMFAGNLVLNSLIKNKDMYDKINRLTKELCDDINEFCKSYKFQMQFCYVGSFYRIIFTNKKIVEIIAFSISNQGLITTVPSIKSTLSKIIDSITFIVSNQSFITTIPLVE